MNIFGMEFSGPAETRYSVSLDVNDNGDGQIDLDYTAARIMGGDGEVSVTFTARLDVEQERIDVIHRDEPVGNIPYRSMAAFSEEQLDEVDPETAWERVRRLLEDGGDRIEYLIDLLPADPLLGCLLKAGLSTAIGQLIRCYLDSRGGSARDTIRRVLRCLGINSLAMIARLLAKLLRCLLSGGLPIPLPLSRE